MRSSVIRLGIFILFSTVLLSCKKDEPAPVVASETPQGIQALINNRSWVADSTSASIDTLGALRIYAIQGEGKELVILLPTAQLKEYKINEFTTTVKATYLDSNEVEVKKYNSLVDDTYSGKIIITAIDTKTHLISGTFRFNLKNTKDMRLMTFEDGTFKNVLDIGVSFDKSVIKSNWNAVKDAGIGEKSPKSLVNLGMLTDI
ncbi:MAG: DUF6252 family protein, partial [Bacteroidota bacterium]